MKKRLLSILLVFCMMVGMLSSITPMAQAVQTTEKVWYDYYASNKYGANIYLNYYKSDNPYYSAGLDGQCTWYCWGRAMERCGVDLPSSGSADAWGNAQNWYTGAERSIAKGRTDFSVGTVPKANSIGVFSKNDGIGHVLFVEDVQNAVVSYSEGNYTPDFKNYYRHHEGTYGINDTIRYAGTDYEERLVGYIYLDSAPYQFDEATGTLTISGSKSIEYGWEWDISGISKNDVKSVIIKDGITGIASNAFENCENLISVTIPGSVNGIGVGAFASCSSLANVVISEGVSRIGDYAFRDCENLTNVSIPSSVATIGDRAFSGCERLNVTIPDGVVHIGEDAFSGCKMSKDLIIPGSVTSIGKYAFMGCSSIETIVIPNSVTSVGSQAFDYCNNLRSIVWPAALPFDAISYSVTHITGVHVKFTGPGAMADYAVDGIVGGWSPILSTVEFENGITRIGDYSFNSCELTHVTIPNSVISIGNAAFFDCDFSDIIIPSSVSTIEEYAFGRCDNLVHVTIPEGVTSIEANAFYDCENLKSVTIPKSIATSLDHVFDGSYITDVYYGGSESDWNAIWPPNGSGLPFATIHFNSTGPNDLKQIVQQLAQQAFKNVLGVASIRCPVDVEISVNGQSVGQIVDNVAIGVDESKIYVYVENDEKHIYFLTSEAFKINLTATGTGTMEYSVQNLNVPSWTTLDEKYFRKVELTSGKKMVSDIDYLDTELVDTPNVQLYVLGGADNSTPVKKVLADNKGTEVPLNTPVITFDAAVDSISILPMAVGDDGILSELPVPTRSGYTFNGWYMPDGTKVDTNTVFTADTTVKAQWTKSSTGGDSPSNPGGSTTTPTVPSGPSYNPGGTYTPPTYSITTPSITGGKVSVSPSSASSGSIVTVTATPDTGYELASLTVSDSTGKAFELTAKGNGQYSFKMPNGKVSLSAEFRLLGTNTSWNNPFVDVLIGDWYYNAVRFVSENGLMNGVGNGYFSPNMNLSRAMFAQILYNKAGQPSAVGSSAFNDVPIGAWYTDAVTWAATNDIVGGYGDGTFGPDDPITREQLAVMLWRYAGKPVPPNLLLNFTDADRVSDYALDALCWAVDQGIINGKGNGILDPKGVATRAEAAQILKNYLAQ